MRYKLSLLLLSLLHLLGANDARAAELSDFSGSYELTKQQGYCDPQLILQYTQIRGHEALLLKTDGHLPHIIEGFNQGKYRREQQPQGSVESAELSAGKIRVRHFEKTYEGLGFDRIRWGYSLQLIAGGLVYHHKSYVTKTRSVCSYKRI